MGDYFIDGAIVECDLRLAVLMICRLHYLGSILSDYRVAAETLNMKRNMPLTREALMHTDKGVEGSAAHCGFYIRV
jgi:hypothetical protein